MVAGLPSRHDPPLSAQQAPQTHADKAYARKHIGSSARLGRRRWVIERTVSRPATADPTTATPPATTLTFLGLAAALGLIRPHRGHGLIRHPRVGQRSVSAISTGALGAPRESKVGLRHLRERQKPSLILRQE